MRHVAIALSIALPLVVAACGADSDDGTSKGAATTVVATAAGSIVGEWERQTTCNELVQALRDARMVELIDEFVAGNGFVPGIGVDDPERVDVERPCEGAVPRVHSHFFSDDGNFGSRDWHGRQVDDGRYRVSGDQLIVSKEFADVTFRFRIDGDTITLDPQNIPPGCTTFRCGWSIAVAYPGKTWTRVP